MKEEPRRRGQEGNREGKVAWLFVLSHKEGTTERVIVQIRTSGTGKRQ